MKMKYKMNTMNSPYIIGLTSFLLPAIIIVIGYKINPTAIPVAILYVSGIINTVRNAGTATSNLPQLIFDKLDAIKIPTIISAGAVTSDVNVTISGEKNIAAKNNTPVTTDANPLLTPPATPPVDSTYDAVVEVT